MGRRVLIAIYMALAAVFVGFSLGALILGSSPRSAEGQPLCGPRQEILDWLKAKYEEAPIGTGVTGAGALFELFATVDRATWTMTVTAPGGRTCLVAAGENWRATKRGSASWIRVAERHDPHAADHWYDAACCDLTDCGPVPASQIKVRDWGYLDIVTGTEFPWGHSGLLPSRDGQMHACRYRWDAGLPRLSGPRECDSPEKGCHTRCLYIGATS